MNRIKAISFVGALAIICISSWLWCHAQSQRLEDRLASVREVAGNAEQVMSLRGREQRASLGERPKQDLIARVNATLTAVGIPRNVVSGVTTEADGSAPLPASRPSGGVSLPGEVRGQAMRVAFKGIQPGQLGAFLERWRETQALWTPTSIEISRSSAKSPAPEVERFDASIVLSVIYLSPAQPATRG